MRKNIYAMYFSATGTTGKIVLEIANRISQNYLGEPSVNLIDFTLPEARKEIVAFDKEDIVVLGVPVYAGRVPNVLLKYLDTIRGNGAIGVPVVVYGNRNYDDALIELTDILESHDFRVAAGGAFIGEHSFSGTLAGNRPDHKDLSIARAFAEDICKKLDSGYEILSVRVSGNKPYRNYYVPKDKEGNPADIRKVSPKTNERCINCKLCARICPMGSIDYEKVTLLMGICIKCCACIKKCPVEAKYFDDPNYLRHKQELEVQFAARREPELFF